MKKKNPLSVRKAILEWLIPFLSLLVISQTLLFVKNSQKKTASVPSTYIPLSQTKEIAGAALKLGFVPAGISLAKGETANVDLVLLPKKNLRLDGVSLSLSFSPQNLEVVQVTAPKLFSSVAEDREAGKEGRIVLTFLEDQKDGLRLEKETKLLTLTVRGKALGESEISLLTTGEGPKTVITESGTSKQAAFDYANLKVVIY